MHKALGQRRSMNCAAACGVPMTAAGLQIADPFGAASCKVWLTAMDENRGFNGLFECFSTQNRESGKTLPAIV